MNTRNILPKGQPTSACCGAPVDLVRFRGDTYERCTKCCNALPIPPPQGNASEGDHCTCARFGADEEPLGNCWFCKKSAAPSSQLTTIARGATKEADEQLTERLSNPQASEEARLLEEIIQQAPNAVKHNRTLPAEKFEAIIPYIRTLQRERDEYKQDAERAVRALKKISRETVGGCSEDVIADEALSSLHHHYES